MTERMVEYDDFLAAVRDRSDLADRDHADQATRAVFDVLGQRLTGGETADLAAQLPAEIQTVFDTHSGDAEGFDLDEFLRRVAEREARGCGPDVARDHATAVLSTLAQSVTAKEFADFRAQLPAGYAPLFEQPQT